MRNVYVLAAAQALSASGMMTMTLLGGILGSELAPLPQLALALAAWPVQRSRNSRT